MHEHNLLQNATSKLVCKQRISDVEDKSQYQQPQTCTSSAVV